MEDQMTASIIMFCNRGRKRRQQFNKWEQLKQIWSLEDDFPVRVIRVVSSPGADFDSATKILLPDEVDITDRFYRITRELREGKKPKELQELDEKMENDLYGRILKNGRTRASWGDNRGNYSY